MKHNRLLFRTCGFLLLALFITGCTKDKPLITPNMTEYSLSVPMGFPEPEIPADNALTVNRVALGKKLFFDPILSKDSTVSCGSCHLPAKAFADPKQFSLGVDDSLSTRNAPPVFNLVYAHSFFWDGGVPTLELQSIAPIQNPLEMHLSLNEAVQRLKEHPQYPTLFKQAYQSEPNLYAMTRAIASFERTLISGNSPYDQYQNQGNNSALNDSQKRGKDIFFGEKAECFHCHTGFNFTDETFQNNGIYETYKDQGRYRITNQVNDIGKFKVPTLRNIALTAPYMHDGSFASLSEVIDHYASGGKNHPNKSNLIRQFDLSAQEKEDLIHFLESLTDQSFINNSAHQP